MNGLAALLQDEEDCKSWIAVSLKDERYYCASVPIPDNSSA